MRVKAKSYAAGTVVNALATLKGVAFGIDLKTEMMFSERDERGFYISDGEKIERSTIAEKLMRDSGYEGGIFRVKSEIPKKSGLGSSSAFMNCLILCAFKATGKELKADRILRLNARMSLETGMSYTGAFDDASASLLGGFVFSDNLKMKLYKRIEVDGKVIILLPSWERGDVDLERIRSDVADVERAFLLAMEGRFREAMFLNSMHYCRKLEVPLEPIHAIQSYNISAGLSGNGPSYVAFGEDVDEVKDVWKDFGEIIVKDIVNEPSEEVHITESLFFQA